MSNHSKKLMPDNGFTLVEMAVVMVILGLLIGGLLMPFNMQMEQRQYSQTNKALEDAKDALLGFAMANGRLPCPADANSNGRESFCTAALPGACGVVLYTYQAHGRCSNAYNGFLPAATLGLATVDNNGFSLDGFGGTPVNRIRYAVSDTVISAINNPFTTTNGLKNAGISFIGAANLIYVCNASPGGAVPYANCGAATSFSTKTAFLIYSVGKNAGTSGGVGNDEIVNPNPQDEATGNDPVFVSHEPTPAANANGEFDDILLWVSSSTLVSKMVSAGQLP